MFVTPAYAQTDGGDPGHFHQRPALCADFRGHVFPDHPAAASAAEEARRDAGQVRRGDTVVTGGGLIGKVTKVIDDDELEIDLGGGTKVTALRSTLSEVRVKGEPVANQNAKK